MTYINRTSSRHPGGRFRAPRCSPARQPYPNLLSVMNRLNPRPAPTPGRFCVGIRKIGLEAGTGSARMIHHFTVDVEEYFQVAALSAAAPPETWDSHPSRVVESTLALAELMEQADARGTMFVLGCVAVQHPGLVKELAARGHEIASHGWA